MFVRSAFPLALALLAAPLAAQECPCGPRMAPHPGGPRMGRHPGGGLMMRGLDLTDAQKASLKAIAEKHREAAKGKFEAAEAARRAFHEAMADPATPADKLKSLHEKVSQAEFELALDRRSLMQESMAVLTPEQKAKAEKMRAERPGPRGRGEGPRHGLPPEGPAPGQK